MKTYAHIRDGMVGEIIEPLVLDEVEVPIEVRYHPDFVAQCVDVTGRDPMPQPGDSYVDGQFVPYAPPVESQADALARAIEAIRRERAPILDALAGMGFDALNDGDAATAGAIAQARRDLKDLTSLPALLAATTYDDMKAVVLARYREIAYALPEDVQVAFRELFAGTK